MARKKKVNDYGTGIPYHEVEALARVLLPEIQAFFESEEGQREFAEWKAQQEQNKVNKTNAQGGGISNDAPAFFPSTVPVSGKFVDATGPTCYN